jgi:protein-ribulosamine 3-kinase
MFIKVIIVAINIDNIVQQIEHTTGQALPHYRLRSIGGGSINDAYQLQSAQQSYFIKLNQPHLSAMFKAEAIGLEEMRALNCIRIPEVICHGQTSKYSYIVLEYIQLGSLSGQVNQRLGTQLAQLHRHSQPYYGWQINNTIGSTPQHNKREHDWLSFWQQHRLGQQLKFASKNGFGSRLQDKGELLLENLHLFFEAYTPVPALLHGDLWGGNAGTDPQGNPVIFDPACYYGDRETDIAMTELFGGFGANFFAAYQAEYPLDPGYKTRKTLYNLYHILNHINLFGSGYVGQAEGMLGQLLSEIK